MQTYRGLGTTLDAGLIAVACAAMFGTQRQAQGTRPPHVDFTITAADYSFQMPRSVAAGRRTIRLVNLGKRFHHAQLLRIKAGERRDSVIARARAWRDPDVPLPGTVSIGGPEGRMPSGDSYATVALEPGEYLVACTIPLDGHNHAAEGMYAPLTVVASQREGAGASRERQPDVVVRMSDYSYALSTARVRRGWRTLRVENAGPAEHIAEVGLLKQGSSLREMLAWGEKGFRQDQEPKVTIGGATRLAVGKTADIHLLLEPGRYVLFCMLHGPGDTHHIRLGMLKELIVE